jgi:hypothetical protein
MLERIGHLEFVLERGDLDLVLPLFRTQDFQGVALSVVFLDRLPDLAGSAGADQPHQAVVAVVIATAGHRDSPVGMPRMLLPSV